MILITGASRGIGKYLLQRFIDTGKDVIGTYYSTAPEKKFEKYLYRVDINKSEDVEAWIEHIPDDDQSLVLINCAGNNYNSMGHKSDIEKWATVVQTNLIGTFNVIKLILPKMREFGYGRIINFSSIVAEIGIPGTSAYAASKSGLWGMTRALAIENAKKGITINTLNLGYFDIGMITEVPEEHQQILKQKIPMGKFGDPENVWSSVNYIIDNDYLNGTSIDINGGLY